MANGAHIVALLHTGFCQNNGHCYYNYMLINYHSISGSIIIELVRHLHCFNFQPVPAVAHSRAQWRVKIILCLFNCQLLTYITQ